MLVAIRTDASTRIGTGHVTRCLTLASALRRRGAEVRFVMREHDGHLGLRVSKDGFGVAMLPPVSEQVADGPLHGDWLGASWATDCEQTLDAIDGMPGKLDWLVVDHYAIDAKWERAVRSCASRVLVIDDLADREHDCDVLVDQNLSPNTRERYIGRIQNAQTLLGPRYAMLRPEYEELHERVPARNGTIQRVLVSYGGVDNANLTEMTVRALIALAPVGVQVDVVVPDTCPHAGAIRRIAKPHQWIVLHSTVPILAPLMAAADLAIGASGTTSWERLCLGLPALVVSVAENQRAIAAGLRDAGVATWIGHVDKVTEPLLERAIRAALRDGVSEEQSMRCKSFVDGRGVARVCAALITDNDVRVRHARSDEVRTLEDVSLVSDPGAFTTGLRDVTNVRQFVATDTYGAELGYLMMRRDGDAWAVLAVESPCDGYTAHQLQVDAILALRREDMSSLRFAAPAPCEHRLRLAVCSERNSWINSTVAALVNHWLGAGHSIQWVHDAGDLNDGEVCFYLSYGRIVPAERLAMFRNNLVVHASALPEGRGWSPLTWQILEGKNRIPVTLFEAAPEVDSGSIYQQVHVEFSGTELVDELRDGIARTTYELCATFVHDYPNSADRATPQHGEATAYPRRRPKDSRLDADRPLREQFNLLRVADPEAYPAWFETAGERYAIMVRRLPHRSSS